MAEYALFIGSAGSPSTGTTNEKGTLPNEASVGRKSVAHSANADGGLRFAYPPYGLTIRPKVTSREGNC